MLGCLWPSRRETDRQRDAPEHGVAGERVTQIMQANILDPGLPAHRIPERQVG